ncbi:EAL and HDOD domain-containing protein [Pseudoduganella namucuonensis]|uniref:EAL and modified HD-GYP domain-containing signal transduction protein n=1 Tax=Pseudoduganella namucuonensis TaxID=1035707 RepID=A0A1I7JNA3_9BURK|nr:HDOD domain-containing protein [Pseudoduganella namucuonensis]SFU86620.1 EAL and modified HD-GYP domain-containing signal transduction protein [Pseudoduganella namucuonensis]
MTVTSITPPFFLQQLADRNGSPAGVLLAGSAAAQPDEQSQALAAQFPCFIRDGMDEQQAWLDAGWQVLPADQTLRADGAFDKAALAANVNWIEGDWPLAPPVKAVGAQAASRALALQLVQLVTNDADTHEIEALLRRDPTLSYHLLKLVNSLGMGTGRRVGSFAQAILILGRQQLRRWLNLMLFSAREGDVRSAMLLARVAVRAHGLELLARETGLGKPQQEQAFMVGMFSLLGVLFGMPLPEVLAPLTVSDAVQQALLTKEGELGALLALLEAAEQGRFDEVDAQLQALQMDAADFNRVVVEANVWMLGVATERGSPHG